MRSMIVIVGVLAALCLACDASSKDIFLPKDCDVVNIVGKGFKLQLTQLDELKQQWKETAEEAAAVDTPRPADSDETIVVNANSAGADATTGEKTGAEDQATSGDNRPVRYLDDDLLRWIEMRAESLVYRVQRYQSEMDELVRNKRLHPNRIVLDILMLNTLVDLDNLIFENIPKMKWLKKKMVAVGGSNIERRRFAYEVLEFVNSRIATNYKLERQLRGKNNPGESWLTNTQAIRRVLHEQRFSKQIGQICVDFLKGSFNMMQRSRVFELNKPAKTLDDGLIYLRAIGQVPAHFPFVSQDAIVNGAYV